MNATSTTRQLGWARTAWYGAELGVALTCIYCLVFIVYAVVRSTVMILATSGLAGDLAGTLIATWVSLAFASVVVAALCATPVALLGAVSALAVRALLTATSTFFTPRHGAVIGTLVCLGTSLVFLALLAGMLKVAWAPATAETLTFWLILPLVIYVLAGMLAGRRLAQLLAMQAS